MAFTSPSAVVSPTLMGGHTEVFSSMFPSKDPRKLAAQINREDAQGWVDCSKIDQFLTDTIVMVAAVDGSDPSMLGLEYAVRGFMVQERDSLLHVLHITDDTKEHLPAKYKPDAVRTHSEAVVMSNLARRRYDMIWVDKKGLSAGCRLVAELREMDPRPDFITMGFWGRKGRGPKNAAAFKTTLLEVVATAKCSVIVMNTNDPRDVPIGRPTKFVVAACLNPAATKAFVDAIRLSKPGDEIHVVYVKSYMESAESDYTIQVREKYYALFDGLEGAAEDGCQELKRFHDRSAVFTVVDKQMRESTSQAVVRYAEDEEADFIVVGANTTRTQRGKDPLGSVSMGICMETSTNFIVGAYSPDFRPGTSGSNGARPISRSVTREEQEASAAKAVDRLAKMSAGL